MCECMRAGAGMHVHGVRVRVSTFFLASGRARHISPSFLTISVLLSSGCATFTCTAHRQRSTTHRQHSSLSAPPSLALSTQMAAPVHRRARAGAGASASCPRARLRCAFARSLTRAPLGAFRRRIKSTRSAAAWACPSQPTIREQQTRARNTAASSQTEHSQLQRPASAPRSRAPAELPHLDLSATSHPALAFQLHWPSNTHGPSAPRISRGPPSLRRP